MKHKQLISSCVKLLDTYNANLHGVQDHVDAYSATAKVTIYYWWMVSLRLDGLLLVQNISFA